MLNTTLFRLIQQQEILGNALLCFGDLYQQHVDFGWLITDTIGLKDSGQIVLINNFVESGEENFGSVLKI